MEEDQEKSKYNEAILQIQRLHESWMKCYQYARSGNLHHWKYELDFIWAELYADVMNRTVKPQDLVDENKKFRKKIIESRTKEQLYESLLDRHQFLKELQDNVGKGGVFEDGTSEDFD